MMAILLAQGGQRHLALSGTDSNMVHLLFVTSITSRIVQITARYVAYFRQ